ncbi:MAG: hypothetical protein K2J33_03300 [Alistipes sp.]|nr:hypothetical protein [Alistipes sp.]
MKKIIFTIVFAAICGHVAAQDIILKNDATEIQAKVLTVGNDKIEYRKWDNPDGPTYTVPAADVFIIRYQNGTKDVITDSRTGSKAKTASIRPKYQGEVAFAFGVGVGEASSIINTNRIAFETVHGARVNPYLFAGAGIGFNYFYGLFNDYDDAEFIDDTAGILPVFVNLKGYYPCSKSISIYMSLDLGAAAGVSEYAEGTEFYTSIGPGLTFGNAKGATRGDFSIRFQHMGTGLNALLFRVGVNF